MGLGLLFLALEQMTSATSPLRNDPGFLRLVARLEQPVWGVLAGAAITAVVQSSAATTGVLLALASQGAMTLSAALAMALGANLGSCATAWIAAWRRPAEGRQAAAVHLLFNLLGVLGWSCFLPQLGRLAAALSDDISRQIAHAHTIFNVANTLILIWFTGPLARAAQWLIPARPGAAPPARGAPRYLDESLLSTPALALDRLRRELGHLGELVQAMLREATPAVLTGSRRELQTVAEADQDVNALHRAVVEYVRRLARREMSLLDSEALEEILAAANELESAGDVISTNIVIQGCRRLDRGLTISPATQVELKQLAAFVETVLASAVRAFVEQDADLARQVRASKEEFQKRAQATLETLRRRLLVDEPARSLTFQIEVDLVSQYQRLHFIARRLAKLVLPNSTAAPSSPAAD
jgi:phosphate:Na+ symporter